MNRKSLLLSAAVVLLGTSCEKPEEQIQPGGDTVSVTATLSDGRNWNDGDQITVNNRKYTIAEGAGSPEAIFKDVVKADTYAAAYDFGLGKVENNILSIQLPAEQGGELVQFHPMAACSSTPDLSFTSLTGKLEIPVTGSATITKIEISATSGDKLTGNATVDLNFQDKPVVAFAESASPLLTLNTGNKQLPARFSIDLAAASYNDLELWVYDNEGNAMNHKIPAVTISGGQIAAAESFEFKTDGPAPVKLNVRSEADVFGNTIWDSKAQININGTSAFIKEGANSETGVFGPVVAADNYYVLAPASASERFGGNTFRVTLPTSLSFDADLSLSNIRAGKADTDNNVSLEYLAGVVKIKIEGNRNLRSVTLESNNEDQPIAGNADVRIGDSESTLEMRPDAAKSISMKSNAGTSISNGKEIYFSVPAGTYADGFTINFIDERNLTYTHETDAVTVTRNVISDLGSIKWESSEADNSNLSAAGYANCYMVSAKGSYHFETRLHDGTAVSNINKADWLWATKTSGSESQQLISDIKYSDGKISFTASENEGNVLIAAFDKAGDIVWSWHIWLTDAPEIINYHNFNKYGDGFYFQDRNLGAVSGEIEGDPAETYGLLYQFGRKDPFYGGAAAEKETMDTRFGNAVRQTICNTAYKQAAWKSEVGTAEQGTVDFATKNPMFFLAGNETDNGRMSWLAKGQYDPFQGPEDGLWKPFEKTNYDPCPPGYQVPRKGSWNGLIYQTTCIWTGTGTETQGMIFTNEEGQQTWYPAQGYRSPHSQDLGALVYEGLGSQGYGHIAMWQSEILTGLDFQSVSVVWPLISTDETSASSYGYSVRCVKEYSYE